MFKISNSSVMCGLTIFVFLYFCSQVAMAAGIVNLLPMQQIVLSPVAMSAGIGLLHTLDTAQLGRTLV